MEEVSNVDAVEVVVVSEKGRTVRRKRAGTKPFPATEDGVSTGHSKVNLHTDKREWQVEKLLTRT